MRVAVLFTGGKDSTYAVHHAQRNGLEVRYLLTMASENPHSWMFHSVNINMTKYQADAMGIEQILIPTTGEKERELEDLKKAMAQLVNEVDGVVNGGISSSYQRSRIDLICRELDLESTSPLWRRDPVGLLREMLGAGLEIIITSVAADGFDESWLGRQIDESCIQSLAKLQMKYGINPSGEGGEYESFVVDAPFFKKRVEPAAVEKVWNGTNGYLLIKNAKIVEK